MSTGLPGEERKEGGKERESCRWRERERESERECVGVCGGVAVSVCVRERV